MVLFSFSLVCRKIVRFKLMANGEEQSLSKLLYVLSERSLISIGVQYALLWSLVFFLLSFLLLWKSFWQCILVTKNYLLKSNIRQMSSLNFNVILTLITCYVCIVLKFQMNLAESLLRFGLRCVKWLVASPWHCCEVGPGRKKLGHWGFALERNVGTLAPSPLSVCSRLLGGAWFLLPHTSAMMCCFAAGPGAMGHVMNETNLFFFKTDNSNGKLTNVVFLTPCFLFKPLPIDYGQMLYCLKCYLKCFGSLLLWKCCSLRTSAFSTSSTLALLSFFLIRT